MAKAATILVVDDEEVTRSAITRALRADGHTVIPIRRGVDAQWLVEHHTAVDLVIADFAAPEADDYHLGIPIGRLLPYTPILFLSAQGRDESIRRGLLHPTTPFLQKPCPPGVLTRHVRALLARPVIPLAV